MKEIKFYTKEEITIIKNDIENGMKTKAIARLRTKDFNRGVSGLLTKIRQIKTCIDQGFTIEQIADKSTNINYKKSFSDVLVVYTKEDIEIMTTAIKTGESVTKIARLLSTELNRPLKGLTQKLYSLKKTILINEPINSLAKIRQKRVLQDKKETVIQQSPSEIGIEVPHGMTFEGKPKKIMLHSDHFRIYF